MTDLAIRSDAAFDPDVTVPLDDVKVFLVNDTETVERFIPWLRRRLERRLAVDTETTGFYWHSGDRVRLAQVGDQNVAWVFPWERWSGLFEAAMRDHAGPIDMMNAKFDWSFLDKAGVRLDRARIDDVGNMAHVLEPHMSRALKNQAKRHVDPRAGLSQGVIEKAMRDNGWTWETIPETFNHYWFYAGLDTILTRRVSDVHRPVVETRSPVAYRLETDFQWIAQQVEAYGAHTDQEYAAKHYEKFTAYCNQVEKWCQDEYGVKPGSNAAIVSILAEAGFEFSKATKSGAVALDAEVLEGIDHPLAQAVLNRRRLQKLASTYLKFYVENADSDGLIHPSINTVGARTSRMSMEHPNLQNLPVRGAHPAVKVIRNCITARSGHTLLFADFDQVEMRGLAILSEDPGLIGAFLDPEDFFVTVARNIYSDPLLIKSDPRRQPTKNAMYAKIYGAGIRKQALTAGVPYEQMRFVNDALNLAYPGIERFSRAVFNEAMRRLAEVGEAYAVCPLTGRWHFADRGKEYALVNYLIQGWAAALFKMKMIELDNAGLGEYIIAFVHDEVLLDVPNDCLSDAAHTLRKVMNDGTMFRVPITAGVSYGKRWGEKAEWSFA